MLPCGYGLSSLFSSCLSSLRLHGSLRVVALRPNVATHVKRVHVDVRNQRNHVANAKRILVVVRRNRLRLLHDVEEVLDRIRALRPRLPMKTVVSLLSKKKIVLVCFLYVLHEERKKTLKIQYCQQFFLMRSSSFLCANFE